MKATKLLLCSLLFLWFNTAFSQQKEEKKKSEISKTSDKVKQTTSETKEAMNTAKGALNDTKELVNDIGGIFKSKKGKTKKIITIILDNIEYGDSNLNALHKEISKAKGVKNVSKKFEENKATFSIAYKKSADELWQSIAENIRNKFKVKSINTNNVFITIKMDD